jgi:hypothetical protein
MTVAFSIGQNVTVKRMLWEPAYGDYPGGLLARPGDRLIVRKIRDAGEFLFEVSHYDRLDGATFGAAEDELRELEPN